MLHAFDVKGVLEAGVKWGRKDGLQEMSDADPLTDDITIRSSYMEKLVKGDSGHVVLKNKLIASLTYRQQQQYCFA